MLRGRWTEENRQALAELLARRFAYPPIAIFDWDGTCARGDVAELVFHQLCRDLAFDFTSPQFTAWVEEIPVPSRILECYEWMRARPSVETRAALRFELERTRHALHESEDDNQAWAWDAGAFVGWSLAAAREYTRRVIARELAQPLHSEFLHSRDPFAVELMRAMEPRRTVHDAQELVAPTPMAAQSDPERVTLELARGLRLRPEMHELVYEMRRRGWIVYLLSASPQWVVEAAAERFFIPPENIIGMRRAVVNGKITTAFEPPCSWGDGKLDAYQMFVSRQRPPNFSAGDSVGDWTLLEWASDCALVVEPTRDALREFARWKQSLGEMWLVQDFQDAVRPY